MRSTAVVPCVLACLLLASPRARAQDAPPPIGPFVVDVRATLPRLPRTDSLAASRGLALPELPGGGLGLDIGAHAYLIHLKIVTLGVGGQLTLARSGSSEARVDGQVVSRAISERFLSVAPQASFNFGSGNGWSYLSGGIGLTTWSIVPRAGEPLPADRERLTTVNYGGGARWFDKPHLAFTFDVRFYAVNPGTSSLGFPASPRIKVVIFGAGLSFK
jgi:hypothetical protein